MKCLYCKSDYVIKNGKGKRKKRSVQRYKCNACGKRFLQGGMEKKQYPSRVILQSIICYNQGKTLKETSKSVNRIFKVKTYPQLISNWISQYSDDCSYGRIRERGRDFLFRKNFDHKQVYQFSYHKLKVEKFINNYFLDIKKYLKTVDKKCPHELFKREGNMRASHIDLGEKVKVFRKNNYACRLANLALKANKDNRKRHQEVQEFMLSNDTSTLACEVPVWSFPEEMRKLKTFSHVKEPVTGHIDVLQQRYGLLYVLDYKPVAEKEKPISQLFFYAFALSVRTGIWLRNFKCAWFDEDNYYEFSPGEIVLQKENLDEKERKKYFLDRNRQLFYQKRWFEKKK